MEIDLIATEHAQQVAKGRYVFRVSPVEGLIDAGRCDSSQSITGITSAGSIMKVDRVIATIQPELSYSTLTVTPGFVSLIWPNLRSERKFVGLLAGSTVAERLGLIDGSYLRINAIGKVHQSLPIAQTLPPSERDEGMDRNLISIAPPDGSVRECLIEYQPSQSEGLRGVLATWFGPQSQVTVSPYLQSSGLDANPQADLKRRTTQFSWMILSLTTSLVSGALWYSRRIEFGLYGLMGMTPMKAMIALCVETVLLVMIPVQLGFLSGLVIVKDSLTYEVTTRLLLIDDCRVLLGIALVPLLGLAVLRSRSTLDNLKGG